MEMKSVKRHQHAFLRHVYDYLIGSLLREKKYEDQNMGLIFKDYERFLELAGLQNDKKDQLDPKKLFETYSFTKEKDGSYTMSYLDFRFSLLGIFDILYADKTRLKITPAKKLEKITSKIFPNLMVNVSDISKNYRIDLRTAAGEMSDFENQFKFPASVEISLVGSGSDHHDSFMTNEVDFEDYVRRRNQELQKQEQKALPNQMNKENEQELKKPRVYDSTWKDRFVKTRPKTCFEKWCRCCSPSEDEDRRAKKGFFPRLAEKVQKMFDSVGKKLGFDVEEPEHDPDDDYYNINRVRKLAPPWEVLVDQTAITVEEAEREYEKIIRKKEQVLLRPTPSNINALVGKIINLYGMISFIFALNINWFPNDPNVSNSLQVLSGGIQFANSFDIYFWISFVAAVLYLLLVSFAIQKLKEGSFGLNKIGKPARFPDREFFRVFVINLIGNTFFTTIVKSLLNALACEYSADINEIELVSDSSMICFETPHRYYLFAGILGLMIYLPVSLVIFPNFQFQDKALDIKYEPYYVVLQTVLQLFLSQSSIFFGSNGKNTDPTSARNQLIANASIFATMTLLNHWMKPCLVRKLVMWDTAFFSIGILGNLVSLLIFYTNNSSLGLAILLSGTFLILLVTGILYKKYWVKKVYKTQLVVENLRYTADKIQPEYYSPNGEEFIDPEKAKF